MFGTYNYDIVDLMEEEDEPNDNILNIVILEGGIFSL